MKMRIMHDRPGTSHTPISVSLFAQAYLVIGMLLILILLDLYISEMHRMAYNSAHALVMFWVFVSPGILIIISGNLIRKRRKVGIIVSSLALSVYALLFFQFLFTDEGSFYIAMFICFSLVPGIILLINICLFYRMFMRTL